MGRIRHSRFAAAGFALLLLSCGPGASAQKPPAGPLDELARARAALVDAAEGVKSSVRELIALRERGLAAAEQKHEQLRQLFAEGLVARVKVEESEQSLAEARASLEELRRQIEDSDRVIAEVAAEAEADKLAKAEADRAAKLRKSQTARLLRPTLGYGSSALIIRHSGTTYWTAANISGVQSFFASAFGRALPVSAHGQTATHTRLGFDHSRGVDVALHPDSAEGRALINYLQSRGISFIAFRGAVAGSATGAHVHIGPPSGRIN